MARMLIWSNACWTEPITCLARFSCVLHKKGQINFAQTINHIVQYMNEFYAEERRKIKVIVFYLWQTFNEKSIDKENVGQAE